MSDIFWLEFLTYMFNLLFVLPSTDTMVMIFHTYISMYIQDCMTTYLIKLPVNVQHGKKCFGLNKQ
jgi:hypothetical protein